MITIHILVYGRVQRVGFRFFTMMNARSLGICGFVQNLPDKTVEVVAQGEKDKLDLLIIKCKKGNIFSKVDKIEIERMKTKFIFQDFKIH